MQLGSNSRNLYILCMITSCPVGPPKMMKPSLSQNWKASQKVGFIAAPPILAGVSSLVILSEPLRRIDYPGR